MPSVERIERHQKAVLWAFHSHDRHGQIKVSSPVELTVRWEEERRSTIGDDGTPLSIDVTVWVDRDIRPLSIMRLGKLASLPNPVTGLMQVITTEKSPDIKGRMTQYSVLLKRYGDTLPEVVS